MAAYSSTYNSRTIRRGQNRVRVQTQDGFGPITKTLLLVLVVGTLGLIERVRGSEFAANLTSDGDVSFANN